MSQPQSRRIVSIQVCRGLAALLVVLAHLHGIETRYCGSDHLHLFEHGALGVDLFFVISGVVIASVAAGKFGSPRNAAVFLYHRLARIFPIFWIYATLTLISRYLSGAHEHSYNLLASYLLIPTHLPMLLLQSWTLSYELYFYLIFFVLLLLVPERLAPWLLALWCIVVVALKLHIGFSPNPIIQLLLSPSVLEFLAGCIIFHIYRHSRLHPSIGILLLAISVLWLAAIILYIAHIHADPYWIIAHPWRRPLLYGSFAAIFLLGAIELERTRNIHYLPLFASIGDWSYSIYLSHALVLAIIARMIVRLPAYSHSIVLITIVGVPAAIFVGYLSYTYLERPLLNLLYEPSEPSRNLTKHHL